MRLHAAAEFCADTGMPGFMCWQMMEKVIREHLGWLVVWGNALDIALSQNQRKKLFPEIRTPLPPVI